ncbi:bacterial Ig-like domain-containing protein [Enterococcus faecalis]|uniref:bacterial Ig-like domain-containing protein n=1 Tax=Enterococcus faecalis TaxID=1351 RepID=UPI00045A4F62|nr:bacterial Ig-like domain-containing protein [Enterococcus faecalis]EKN1382957.1 bacterial Ig-like domain-containing protein [Enterococcus faecalis]KAJ71618.1 hypothetical protein P786_1030 [Enterococcus faecalis MD6]
MKKKAILLLTTWILLFYGYQEQTVFSETETTLTNGQIEPYLINLKVKDSKIYVGDSWHPRDNFIGGDDGNGNVVEWGHPLLTTSGAVNVREPGVYKIFYYMNNHGGGAFAYVTVEDNSSIKVRDTEVFIGESWSPEDNFVSATDKYGSGMNWGHFRITHEGTVDISKPGIYKVKYKVDNDANGRYATASVRVKDESSIKTKDSKKYVGESWDPKENFVSARDRYGRSISWGDPRITYEGTVDVSKPGIYNIKYKGDTKGKAVYSTAQITVKEDETIIKTRDSEIYVGEPWFPEDNFVSALDEDGNPVYWGDPRIAYEGTVDISKPGINEIEYSFTRNGNGKRYIAKVKVKENKSSIKTKDSEIYVGERWVPKENFVSATDEDGHSVPWEDPRIIKNGASIDTSKPGIHKMKYTHRGKVKDIDSEFTVTVKKEAFTIKEVPFFDFEDHILASTNKSVVNKKENPIIEVETPSIEGKDWQLQVELSPFLDKENSNSILKGVSLFIPKGKLESDLETEEPNQYDCQLEANGKASILMHGTKTKGKGRWKNKLETKGITLSIPPENKTGNYESTLHWTLLDVPG